MEYVEKGLLVEEIERPDDLLNLEEIAKLPVSLIEHFLYKNIDHSFIDGTGNSNQADDLVHEAAELISN